MRCFIRERTYVQGESAGDPEGAAVAEELYAGCDGETSGVA